MSPIPKKRARKSETTTNSKRANEHEDSYGTELADMGDDPDAIERANKNEDSDIVERPINPLRWMADAYTQTQKLRIQIGNQLSARERGDDQTPTPSSVQGLYGHLKDAERAMAKDFEYSLKGHKAMRWLGRIKGIGPTLAVKLLSQIDIERSTTPSKLWRYAGYGVIIDAEGVGHRERPVKGQKLTYNIRLKTTCYLIATSFMRGGSPYRKFYDSSKAYYEANRPDWTKAHIHSAALRKMTKMFLSHLWLTWREAEGLPTRATYVEEKLGHDGITDPWEMVEKE